MAELTIEQKRALALAAARKRAAEAGAQSAAADAPAPPSPAAQEAFAAASAVNPLNRPAPPQPANLMDIMGTFVGNAVEGIPIVGPSLQAAGDFIGTETIGRLMGKDPAQYREELAAKRQALDERYPVASLTGSLTGGVVPLLATGGTTAGAQALGLTGKFGERVANSAISSGLIAGADTAARGGDMGDVMANTGIGAGLGTVFPVVGAGASAFLRATGERLQPTIGAMTNPTKEAQRRVGMAMQRDIAANPQAIINSSDEAVAAATDVPLVNADRGDETMRALARSVANQSPEARSVLTKAADDRFEAQAARAVEVMRKMAGGNVDDLQFQDSIRTLAKAVNDPAYKAAYNAPEAQSILTQNIRQLMQSDAFREAAALTNSTATDFAAVTGGKAVRNPFVFGPDGSFSLAKMADGSVAVPNLQYWDMVKRNLDGMIGTAQRKGDNTRVSLLTQMKQMLTRELDATVPAYAKARSGAAAFFDAEDALDAGKKFANAPRDLPEAEKAFASMNTTEKQAFRVGFSSEVVDKIKSVPFRANVIKTAFGSPAKREMMAMVFGPAKAQELEAYIRVEDLADRLRGVVTGNSTSVRQLVELGLAAGGGFAVSGGDWKGALGGAALARGLRYIGSKADAQVMQEMAKLLTSSNPNDIKKAVAQATLSQKWMEALREMERLLAIGARATSINAPAALVGAEG